MHLCILSKVGEQIVMKKKLLKFYNAVLIFEKTLLYLHPEEFWLSSSNLLTHTYFPENIVDFKTFHSVKMLFVLSQQSQKQ